MMSIPWLHATGSVDIGTVVHIVVLLKAPLSRLHFGSCSQVNGGVVDVHRMKGKVMQHMEVVGAGISIVLVGDGQ